MEWLLFVFGGVGAWYWYSQYTKKVSREERAAYAIELYNETLRYLKACVTESEEDIKNGDVKDRKLNLDVIDEDLKKIKRIKKMKSLYESLTDRYKHESVIKSKLDEDWLSYVNTIYSSTCNRYANLGSDDWPKKIERMEKKIEKIEERFEGKVYY